jgi:hypothetical protein
MVPTQPMKPMNRLVDILRLSHERAGDEFRAAPTRAARPFRAVIATSGLPLDSSI